MKHRYTWSFRKMHPVLQVIVGAIAGIATMGYVIFGSWMLYVLMTR